MTETTAYPAIFPDLEGASVFITGGGSGIGASLTEGFLRQGAKVAFVQRSDASAFADEMAAATGNRPLFMPCDITDVTALQGSIATAAERHGPVTVLSSHGCLRRRDKNCGEYDSRQAGAECRRESSKHGNLFSFWVVCLRFRGNLTRLAMPGQGAVLPTPRSPHRYTARHWTASHGRRER